MIDLGYTLFSKRVADLIGRDEIFAAFVGRSLHRHLKHEVTSKTPLSSYLPGVNFKSSFVFQGLEFWIITELDKNKMSRTTVVFPEEGGT